MGYEFLLAGLPDLKAGAASPMSMDDLLTLFGETLSAKDLQLIDLLHMPSDPAEVEAKYELGLASKNRFIREWFAFNQDMNNVLTAVICRRHGFDVSKAIVGHNVVAEILRKDLPQKDFGLAAELDNLDNILALVEIDNLMEREKQMDAIRFVWLEEKTLFVNFSIENVLAYYLQAQMLNRWAMLTVEQGEKVFRELVADMKKGIRL